MRDVLKVMDIYFNQEIENSNKKIEDPCSEYGKVFARGNKYAYEQAQIMLHKVCDICGYDREFND